LYKVNFERLAVTRLENAGSLGGASEYQLIRTELKAKNMARWHFALTCYNKERLIVSGGHCLSTLCEVFTFIIARNDWGKLTSMIKPRQNHSSCVLKTKVFYIGGTDHNMKRLTSVEWSDVISGERDIIEAAFDVPRELPVVGAVSDSKLIIMGGIGDSGKLSDVLLFDTTLEGEERKC